MNTATLPGAWVRSVIHLAVCAPTGGMVWYGMGRYGEDLNLVSETMFMPNEDQKLAPGDYFWRVRKKGGSVWSDVHAFAVNTDYARVRIRMTLPIMCACVYL